MEINTRRNFFGKIAAMAAFVTGAPKLFLLSRLPLPAHRRLVAHPGAHLAEIRLVAPAAVTTHTMASTTSPARAPMTAIPRRITSW